MAERRVRSRPPSIGGGVPRRSCPGEKKNKASVDGDGDQSRAPSTGFSCGCSIPGDPRPGFFFPNPRGPCRRQPTHGSRQARSVIGANVMVAESEIGRRTGGTSRSVVLPFRRCFFFSASVAAPTGSASNRCRRPQPLLQSCFVGGAVPRRSPGPPLGALAARPIDTGPAPERLSTVGVGLQRQASRAAVALPKDLLPEARRPRGVPLRRSASLNVGRVTAQKRRVPSLRRG